MHEPEETGRVVPDLDVDVEVGMLVLGLYGECAVVVVVSTSIACIGDEEGCLVTAIR